MSSKETKKKLPSYNVIKISLSVFMGVFIILGTILVYYYAKGYRFNTEEKIVLKTGVISAETEPSRANLYVDGELIGKTPKSAHSIEEGEVKVEVWKSKYKPWETTTTVLSEKSTPLYPYLVLEEPIRTEIFQTTEELIEQQYTDDGNYIFFITRDLDVSNTTGTYKIWKYDINRYFWDLSDNPKVVYEQEYSNLTNISIQLSPDSKLALLKTTVVNEKKEDVKNIELLHTAPNGALIEQLDLNNFIDSYTFTWSENSKYLLLENDLELISIKISDKKKFLVYKKENNNFIWNTDTLGFIYFIEKNNDGLSYNLSQMLLDGTEEKIIIQHIYTGTDLQLIEPSRELEQVNHTLFTNAPENKMFVGEINKIQINQEAQGVIFSTSEAMYWYNIEDKQYITINNYPSEIISFSEESTLLLLKDSNNKLGIFTHTKEESDHITEIGTYFFKDSDTTDEKWISNEYNITYLKDNALYISDTNGSNNYEVQIINGTDYQTSFNRNYLYTTELSEENFTIVQYKIN